MPDPTPSAARPPRRGAASGLVLLGLGLALAPVPALAWPEDGGYAPPRPRRAVRMRAESMGPPPALVSGYLPRNNNVPMYNEPPRGRLPGGPAW